MSAEPLFDQSGSVVGWVHSDGSVIDYPANRWVIFTGGDGLFSWRNGQHVGWMENGWVFDIRRRPVAFTRNATGGPARPGRRGVPGRPGVPGKPGKPGRAGMRGKPGRSNSWASWSDLISSV